MQIIYYRCRFLCVCSVAQSCLTLCNPMNRSTPGLPVHHQLLEFTQTHVHRVSDAIQPFPLCRPLLLLPPIPPSIRVFSNESTLRMRWPKYWSCVYVSDIHFCVFFRDSEISVFVGGKLKKKGESISHSVMFDSLPLHGL